MGGFTVTETIPAPATDVWEYLTDFSSAGRWMPGVSEMSADTSASPQIGQRLVFRARGRERESYISALRPGELLSLTSTQGGITATYTYAVKSVGDATEVTLNAECSGKGAWKIVSPLIAWAMTRSDSVQLVSLRAAIVGPKHEEAAR